MEQKLMATTRSDWDEIAKNTSDYGSNVSRWNQFLTGIDAYYKPKVQQVQDAAAYDISSAYANYKKQQLQLKMNEQLGAGFKQQVGSQLQSEYGTAYKDIKTEESANLAKVQEQYDKTVEQASEQFSQWGEVAKQLQEIAYEWGTTNVGTINRPMYDVTQNKNGELEYTPSGYTKDYFAKILTNKNFEDYLYKEHNDLYEAYVSDVDAYNKAIAGIELENRSYTDKYYKEAEEKYNSAAITQIENKSVDSKKLQELYGENYKNLTTVQAEEIANKLQATPEYVDTVRDPSNREVGYSSVSVYGGAYQWTVTSDSANTELAKEFNLVQKVLVDKTISPGDVLKIKGQYYQVVSLLGIPTLYAVTDGEFHQAGTTQTILDGSKKRPTRITGMLH